MLFGLLCGASPVLLLDVSKDKDVFASYLLAVAEKSPCRGFDPAFITDVCEGEPFATDEIKVASLRNRKCLLIST